MCVLFNSLYYLFVKIYASRAVKISGKYLHYDHKFKVIIDLNIMFGSKLEKLLLRSRF